MPITICVKSTVHRRAEFSIDHFGGMVPLSAWSSAGSRVWNIAFSVRHVYAARVFLKHGGRFVPRSPRVCRRASCSSSRPTRQQACYPPPTAPPTARCAVASCSRRARSPWRDSGARMRICICPHSESFLFSQPNPMALVRQRATWRQVLARVWGWGWLPHAIDLAAGGGGPPARGFKLPWGQHHG